MKRSDRKAQLKDGLRLSDQQSNPDPNQKGGKEKPSNCHVYIDPGIKIDFVDDLREQYKTSQNDQTIHQNTQLFWTKIAAGLLLVTAIFTGWQGCSTKIAADAAKSAADTAKSTLTASQGAYVTIGRKDGVVAEFVTSKDHPDENVPLIVYFQNTGHIPARVAWDTFDRKDGTLESFGIHRFTTGMGRTPLPPGMLGKNGEFYEAVGKVIAGESVGRNELAYISQSDLEKLSEKIVGFYIDGYYAYCDQLGTWSTHQFTLNYHTDIPTDLRFELISDIEIANPPIPKSIGGKSYFPPCTSTVVMSETEQYASPKAK